MTNAPTFPAYFALTLQSLSDKNGSERLISWLNGALMTIFIFMRGSPLLGLDRSRRPLLAGLMALVFLCVAPSPVRAGRFFSARDRAQGDTLYQQAFAAYQTGDYAQAQDLVEKADALKPDQPDGWNLRGMVYLKQNAFDKAEAAFSRAVSLDPKLWAAQFNLAEAPFQGKDYARARARFEKLIDQTDRFKTPKEWELVQYKAFLSCLLMGDHAAADKKLAKLPATGGTTPAYQYAQASMAFSRKDAAGARKSLTAAQGAYSPLLNDMFSNSLVEVGWQTPLPPPTLAVNLPNEVPPASGATLSENRTPIVIDPRLEASVAEPLPTGDTAVRPVASKIDPVVSLRPTGKSAAALPAPSLQPAPSPVAESSDHRGLLLE